MSLRTLLIGLAAMALLVTAGCTSSSIEADPEAPSAESDDDSGDADDATTGDDANGGSSDTTVPSTAASDDIWVIDRDSQSVLRVDTQENEIVAETPIGGLLSDISVDGDGVWIVDRSRRSIFRIDIEDDGAKQANRFDDESPERIDAAGGQVWFTGSRSDGKVVHLDPSDGSVLGGTTIGARVDDLAVAPDAVWVASKRGSKVVRVDPATYQAVAEIPFEGAPRYVVAIDGAVWVGVELDERSEVVRIDPATNQVVWRHDLGDRTIDGMDASGDAIWISHRPTDEVTRVTVASNEVQTPVARVADPAEIAAGDGGVWVVTDFGEALTRLGAESGEPIGTLRPGVTLERPESA